MKTSRRYMHVRMSMCSITTSYPRDVSLIPMKTTFGMRHSADRMEHTSKHMQMYLSELFVFGVFIHHIGRDDKMQIPWNWHAQSRIFVLLFFSLSSYRRVCAVMERCCHVKYESREMKQERITASQLFENLDVCSSISC